MPEPTRRKFFSFAAGAMMASPACRSIRTVKAGSSPDTVNVAVIGLGLRGQLHLTDFGTRLPDARIVAVCDVNQESLERGQAKVKRETGRQPKAYQDLRRVFDDK